MESAKTTYLPYALHKIPLEALKRIGARFRKGAEVYGDDNWKHGKNDKAYQQERANHALAHLLEHIDCLLTGQPEADDNLAAVAWYCVTQMALERQEVAPAATHLNAPPSLPAPHMNGTAKPTTETPHLHDMQFTTIPFASLSPVLQGAVREGYKPGTEWWLYDDNGERQAKNIRPRPDEVASLIINIPL